MGGSEAREEVGRETRILGAETWEVTRAQCNNVTLTHDTGGTRYPGPHTVYTANNRWRINRQIL